MHGLASKTDQVWLTRKEAALYLTSIGCPVAYHTLANMARGDNAFGGPAFHRVGWHTVRYKREDLEKWADKKCVRIE